MTSGPGIGLQKLYPVIPGGHTSPLTAHICPTLYVKRVAKTEGQLVL